MSTYMNGLAASDLDAMASSFAIETFVDQFDFRAYLERIRAYSAAATPMLVPPATPLSRALAVEERHGDVIGQILYQYLALADPAFDPFETVVLSDDAVLDDFYNGLTTAVASVDMADASSFTFVPLADVDAESAERYESEQNQANLDSLRQVLGADELTDLVVRFTVSGHEYFAFFSVARYGDAWWVEQLGGNFASLMGIPPLRVGAAPTEETPPTTS